MSLFKDKSVLGVIPARGGSKGLPGKNIMLIMGKPLIAWTIEQALLSKCIDRVIVSTDNTEIADISRRFQAEVPFIRPPELANDTAKGIDVLLHAMDWVEKNEKSYDLVMYLQPTSPLRTSEDIINTLQLMEEKKAQAIVSVCKAEHPPEWSNTLTDNLSLNSFVRANNVNKNRQDIQPYYRLNGAIYLACWDYIKKNKSWFKEDSYAYIMPTERSVDIDTEIDLLFAEFILMKKNKQFKP